MLRAQVDRLQTELREYKRRLHANEMRGGLGGGLGAGFAGGMGMGGGLGQGEFQFNFPSFGGWQPGKDKTLTERFNEIDKKSNPSISSNGSKFPVYQLFPTAYKLLLPSNCGELRACCRDI
jgi:hypothetical protein